MENNVIVIHPGDNVAVAIKAIKAGDRIVGIEGLDIVAGADIPPSHKVAIIAIPKGKPVIKYGEFIGNAKEAIRPGDWVHTHNINTEEG